MSTADEPQVVYEERMSDADALMWGIEKDPMLRSTITTVCVLDGSLRRDVLRREFDRITRAIPRLRERVRSNPLSIAPPRWEVDPNFDLDYHLRFARVPGSGGADELLRMAQPLAMQSFDRARPLWEAVVVEDLGDDQSAVILKIHHSITDGVGGVRLMLELFDLEPDAPERPMPDAPEAKVLNQAERFVDAFQHESRRQLRFLGDLAGRGLSGATTAVSDPAGTVDSVSELVASTARILRPVSHPLSPLMTGRSLSTHFGHITLPLDRAKMAGKAIGGTINDTFVTGLVQGFRIYHHEHGVELPGLRMGMPINVRAADAVERAGNDFVPARFELPTSADDLADLMRGIRERMVGARNEPANQLVEVLSNALNRLPTSVVTQIFGTMMKGLDFQASNVPGSPIPIYLRGVPVRSITPFGPIAGAAANVTLLSYQNELNIGINADPAAVTEPDLFVECVRRGYDEVLALA
ncbi:MAG: wax ester/triacylglycerol synthase domain-containing protein [Microthrixaceae bacterium]|jgi:WS/DGAT/MGAT family acyltransferase